MSPASLKQWREHWHSVFSPCTFMDVAVQRGNLHWGKFLLYDKDDVHVIIWWWHHITVIFLHSAVVTQNFPGATMSMHVYLGLDVAEHLISILPAPYSHCCYTMYQSLYSTSPRVISILVIAFSQNIDSILLSLCASPWQWCLWCMLNVMLCHILHYHHIICGLQ